MIKTNTDTAPAQKRILLLNQIDRLERRDELLVWLKDYPDALPISAQTGEGLDELKQLVLECVLGPQQEVVLEVLLKHGQTVDFIERRTEVLDREYGDATVRYTVRLGRRQVEQMLARGGEGTLEGLPLKDAIERLWPSQPWSAPVIQGRDGVLEPPSPDPPEPSA